MGVAEGVQKDDDEPCLARYVDRNHPVTKVIQFFNRTDVQMIFYIGFLVAFHMLLYGTRAEDEFYLAEVRGGRMYAEGRGSTDRDSKRTHFSSESGTFGSAIRIPTPRACRMRQSAGDDAHTAVSLGPTDGCLAGF